MIGIIVLIVLIVVGVIFIMKKKYTGVLLPSGLSRKYEQDTQKVRYNGFCLICDDFQRRML